MKRLMKCLVTALTVSALFQASAFEDDADIDIEEIIDTADEEEDIADKADKKATAVKGEQKEQKKVYEGYEACRKKVIIPRPPTAGTTSWLTYSSARGAGRFALYGLWVYNCDGRLFVHYTPTYQFNTVGSILALPLGDFAEMETYDINTKDLNGKPRKGITKKIAVNVHISYPSATKPPPEFACQRMVENLVTSGMNIPHTMGKPCRLMPLRQTAMMRYGAKKCYPDYSMSDKGTVILLLEDCDPKRARPYIVPAIAVGKAGSARSVEDDGVKLEKRKNEINDGYTASELYDLIRAHRHKVSFF